MTRCTGHCCRHFTLSSPIEHIRSWVDHPDAAPDMREECRKIADMVVALPDEGDDVPRFTCRHYDPETRDCVNYDDRPDLCRNPGVTVNCDTEGCTLRAPAPDQKARTSAPREAAGALCPRCEWPLVRGECGNVACNWPHLFE